MDVILRAWEAYQAHEKRVPVQLRLDEELHLTSSEQSARLPEEKEIPTEGSQDVPPL